MAIVSYSKSVLERFFEQFAVAAAIATNIAGVHGWTLNPSNVDA